MKERILEAAAKVFSQKGYHKASVEDISLQAGVAKGSLYYHFKNKAEIFEAVVVEGLDWLSGEVGKVMQSDLSDTQIVSSIIDRMTAMLIDYPELCDILMNEMSVGIDEETRKSIGKAFDRFVQILSAALQEGQKQGILADFDCDLVASGTLSFVYAYWKSAVKKGMTDRKKITEGICRIVIDGLFLHQHDS